MGGEGGGGGGGARMATSHFTQLLSSSRTGQFTFDVPYVHRDRIRDGGSPGWPLPPSHSSWALAGQDSTVKFDVAYVQLVWPSGKALGW